MQKKNSKHRNDLHDCSSNISEIYELRNNKEHLTFEQPSSSITEHKFE